MRVLVTGASGLLGTWLLRTVPPGIDAVAATRASEVDWPEQVRGDLRDPERTRDLVQAAEPDVIIHAAYQRDRPSIVEATRNLVAPARDVGAPVALISTDAVFSGDGHARGEEDPPDPVWDYGAWKAEAERLALGAAAESIVIRLPLLVSVDPPDGMARRVREAAAREETVGWYRGERRQPVYAEEVARAVWRIVAAPPRAARGVWHLPGPERLTRSALGARIAEALGVPDPGVEIPAPDPESRPRDLHLTTARAGEHISWEPTPVLRR